MAKLDWDQTGKKIYEVGVDMGVLYPQDATGAYPAGEAWNGLTGVTESPEGAEPTKLYANNGVYVTLISAETLNGTIEAYTYPDGFKACNGEAEIAAGVTIGQQRRTPFGLVYRSKIGNDTLQEDYGYKLHLIWGATVSPSESAHETINEDPEVEPMSWEFTTTPVAVEGKKPTASLVIDSTKVDKEKLAALEKILFGDGNTESGTDARLPLPAEVIAMFGTTEGEESVQG